ncbi:MAG: FAD:protein FMN transferase [Lentisphaerae bacterium]|nr:FAD:protein FMN transferase [Lentisphaerota bacterium]
MKPLNDRLKLVSRGLLLAGLCMGLLVGCKPRTVSKSFEIMGATATVTLPKEMQDELEGFAQDIQVKVLQKLDDKFNVRKPSSEISRINAKAGDGPVAVSSHTMAILEKAQRYALISDGAFDVTAGPLLALWGVDGGKTAASPPSEASVQAVLPQVGYKHLILKKDTAFLDVQGAQIDLGSIARGFAVDMASKTLWDGGLKDAMVEIGGTSVRVLGYPKNGVRWSLDVRNPFEPEKIVGSLNLPTGFSVSTAGNDGRWVVIQGKRVPPILDPRCGLPATNGLASVTVIVSDKSAATDAAALSSTFFVMGILESARLVKRIPHQCEIIFIPNKQPLELWITPGLKDAKLFKPSSAFAKKLHILATQ